uniref:MobC family plasmid mobilization relaxosome protein n=1 Tax=Sphaerisporangium sp. CA-236357 TaxID=3240030 RepID=UPI003F49A2F8
MGRFAADGGYAGVTSDGRTEDQDHGGADARRPVRRQRRQEGGRPHKHTVRLSEDEQDIIAARADEAGVSVPRFLAEAGVAGDARTASERRAAAAELLAVRRLLAAIGGNINQLAKTANATGERPSALEATMHATARILARLDEVTAAYGHLGLPHGLRPERGHAAGHPDAGEALDVDVEGRR